MTDQAALHNEPDDISDMIAGMTIAGLVEMRDRFQTLLQQWLADPKIVSTQQKIARLNKELTIRVHETVKAAYADAQKEDGTLTVKSVPGVVVKGSISKKVEWDQTKLMALASTLPWDKVQHYFKLEFSVPEAIFKAVEPGPMRDALVAARTVKRGDLSVTVSADSNS